MKKVWEVKEKHGDVIFEQLSRIGASLDYDRYVFTLDPHMTEAVSEGFIRLFEKGLIYRDIRLVNWSTALETAISDIEVDYIDIEKKTDRVVPGYKEKVEFGVIVYFVYKLKEDPKVEIEVATTRIETMLGDVAVAVHPEDERYTKFVGKELIHPFFPDRKMVIVADDFVEKDFGTGAVKITPAHDPNDYECGKKHGLEFISLFTNDGLVNENGGNYKGLKRFDLRKIIEKDLDELGLLKDKKDHKMRLSICSRSKDVIEPMIKPQWYIKCTDIAQPMIEAVEKKELLFTPPEEAQTWFRWIKNLKDWCISRQLWWGHRIPAFVFYKQGDKPKDLTTNKHWLVAKNRE